MEFSGPTAEQPTDAFWRLVELARDRGEASEADVAKLDQAELVEFYWTYQDAADVLRDPPWADRLAEGLSEDGVDDAVRWVVAQGRAFYEDVLAHPDRMPARAGRWYDVQGAAVAHYEDRFDEALPFPEDFEPRDAAPTREAPDAG